MGIRKQLAAHDARFISFDDLLSAVAEAEGVSVAETARHMSINGVLNGATHRLRNWVNGSYAEGCGDAADYLIESAIHPDKKIWISDAAQNEMNAGEPGFFRDEIAGTLSACGIAIPTCLQSSAAQAKPAEAAKAVPAPPQQKLAELLPFVQRVNVTLNEAADLLAEANGGRWYAALEDAADSGQVQAGTWSVDRGEQPLSHADLRAWCEAGGFIWPVPLPPAPTAIEKLFQATQENGRSTIELDILRQELEAVTKERDRLRADLEHLRTALNLNQAARSDGWTKHSTRLFNLLPTVIEMAKQEQSWPKQAVFIPEMVSKFGIYEAEAKALDAVTRPDERRRK